MRKEKRLDLYLIRLKVGSPVNYTGGTREYIIEAADEEKAKRQAQEFYELKLFRDYPERVYGFELFKLVPLINNIIIDAQPTLRTPFLIAEE